MKIRIISFLLVSVFVSTSLQSIPVGPLTKPFTKLFSKQGKEIAEIADGSVVSKLSRNLSDDLSRINKLNERLFTYYPSDSSINYIYRLDEKFSSLDAKTKTQFLNAWKSKSSTNLNEMRAAYMELTSISQNETFDSFVSKLGKIEATLIAGLFGATFTSIDAEAAKGGMANNHKLRSDIKPDDLETVLNSIYKEEVNRLSCLQAYEITNLRDQKTYLQFQSQVPACPSAKPDQDLLENYFAARISK
tara:strand:- start:65 stop:805 length:741 start_codon:yes stop_codon:yes gene_type:complete